MKSSAAPPPPPPATVNVIYECLPLTGVCALTLYYYDLIIAARWTLIPDVVWSRAGPCRACWERFGPDLIHCGGSVLTAAAASGAVRSAL